ncbi:MAG TPA: phage tail tube protein [Tissierellaceae bacterium]
MDELEIKATRSLGTTLEVEKAVVGGLTSINGLELSADTIDVTTLNSEGGYREFIAGFKDSGEVAVSGYLLLDGGQSKIYDAFESGETVSCAIKFPKKINANWEFKAIVVGFSTGADLEDPLSFEATLKVSGKPTLNKGLEG